MWKITTRGFTLQEVLIMAAMNVVDSDRQRRANDWLHLGQATLDDFSGLRLRNRSEVKT